MYQPIVVVSAVFVGYAVIVFLLTAWKNPSAISLKWKEMKLLQWLYFLQFSGFVVILILALIGLLK